MNILTLITLLASSNWTTTCVMTQADGLQGYTIDTVAFQKASADKVLDVAMTRVWYKNDQCSDLLGAKSTIKGTVALSALELAAGTMSFPASVAEDNFAADWTMDNKPTQLGEIAVASDGKSIRMATTSFGNTRNTMLSLIRYFSK
jgi:hypothetical protein